MKNILLVISFLVSLSSFAQDKGYWGGFQFKGLLPIDYFTGGAEINNEVPEMQFSTTLNSGYSFGMTVRKKFNKTLAVESGLRLTRRNYGAVIDSTASSFKNELSYSMQTFEIPLKGMVSLRASDNSYFSVGFGVQLDLYPSDVQAKNEDWMIQTHRKSWLHGSLVANAGWEIDVKDVGIFYAGLAFTSPFGSPYTTKYGERNSTYALAASPLSGNYFALDIRYYFNQKNTAKKDD